MGVCPRKYLSSARIPNLIMLVLIRSGFLNAQGIERLVLFAVLLWHCEGERSQSAKHNSLAVKFLLTMLSALALFLLHSDIARVR